RSTESEAASMFESFTAGALRALERSEARARLRGAPAIEPDDLLAALVDEPESRAATLLDQFGLVAPRLFATLGQPEAVADAGEAVEIGRILDASASRAREGLRVVENYVRFVLDDPGLTRRLKEVRHRLAAALGGFDAGLLLASRDVRGDVGTHIMTASE